MNKTDRIVFGLVLGIMFPAVISLLAITAGMIFQKETSMPYLFAGGIVMGLIIDILFLRKLLNDLFGLPVWTTVVAYVICNVLIYGMFMGFPVFNLLMGIIAGYYTARKIDCRKIESPRKEILIRNVLLFTVLIMLIICISTAFLAFNEKTIGEELQSMLGLNFIPPKDMIIAGTVTGGVTLITAQYLLTRYVINKVGTESTI